MGEFLNLVVNGLASGGVYALLAVGLVLAYRTSGTFNFGHGAVAFSAAYVYYQLNTGLGWPKLMCFLAVVGVFGPLVGFVWDALVFRRLAGASDSIRIVSAVGVMIVTPAFTLGVFELLDSVFGVEIADTSNAFIVPGIGPTPAKQWRLTDGAALTSDQAIVLTAGLLVVGGLWFLLHRTRLGLSLSAAVDSPNLAELRGTSVTRMSRLAWLLSSSIAALAGVLGAPFAGAFGLSQFNFTVALFVAATACVIARFTSLPVAFGAALGLGAARNLASGYLSESHLGSIGGAIERIDGLRSSLPFWLLLGTLVVLGASRSRRAGLVAVEGAPARHNDDISTARRAAPWVVGGGFLVLQGLVVADSVWHHALLTGMALGLVFLSFTVVTGIGGMVSLAQTAFVTSAALVCGRLVAEDVPFLLALVAGVAVATVLGLVVALPALRLGGLSLTLASLALALLADQVLFKLRWLGGTGTAGWSVPAPELGPIDLSSDNQMFIVLLIALALTTALVMRLPSTAWGRTMTAVRMAEPAASCAGISPHVTKLVIFGLSAAIAGFGGVMLAVINGSAKWTTSPPQLGFVWLAVVVTWGVRRPGGAVVAGVVFAVFPLIVNQGFTLGWLPGDPSWNGISSALIPPLLFGLGAVGLAKSPEGIIVQLEEQRRRRRARTEPSRSRSAPVGAGPVPSDGPLLQICELRSGYGEIEVLHGVDLTVLPGRVHGIVGPNGAGKSTLVAAIAGTIDTTSGRVWFDGADVTDQPAHRRARAGIVVVPESRGVFGGLTVENNLRVWLPRRDDIERALEEFPRLAERRHTPASSLSGGEQQMLSLAALLVSPPKLLIIDEATLGLAPMVASSVLRLLGDLRDRGVAILIVAEKVSEVLRLADTVSVITLGRLGEALPVGDVSQEVLASAYLGTTLHQIDPNQQPPSDLELAVEGGSH